MTKRNILTLLLAVIVLVACKQTTSSPTATPQLPEPTHEPAKISTVAPFRETGLQLAVQQEIININWQWVSLTETDPAAQSAVPEPEKYTLMFWDDGTFNLIADCNQGQGTYELDDDQIQFGPIATTMAMCPPESLHDQFLALLGQVEKFGMDKDQLAFVLSDGAGQMNFSNGGTAQRPIAVYEKTLYVGPEQVECDAGAGETTCYQVKDTLEGQWQLFYDQIQGFEWEPGYVFEIQVKVTEMPNPASDSSSLSYELVEVLSKTPADEVNFTGLDLASVSLDLQGLPYSYQASLVAESPYSKLVSGSVGLPQHVQVNFVAPDAGDTQPGNPILYIIPVDAYVSLWNKQDDPAVADSVAAWREILTEDAVFPSDGLPVLPFEQTPGVNDLAVQEENLDFYKGAGVRFVGRFSIVPQVVTNEELYYIFQGFSQDGNYFIAFFYPVGALGLPNNSSDVSTEENQSFQQDPEAYLDERVEFLNGLPDTDWLPHLSLLDTVLSSLDYDSVFDDPTRPTPSPTEAIGEPESSTDG